ncbi:hypothetical protein ACGFJT_08920 [Actinomadura geliboluensis]|uniref:hypothetical protein n=1 Tax=Actinomadura geliboluensis TaxID=882440 RepID=UPI00371510B1
MIIGSAVHWTLPPPLAREPSRGRLAKRGASERLGAEGMFDVRTYPDLTAARSAIEDREVYGALVLPPGGTTLLKASAGSQVAAPPAYRYRSAARGPTRASSVKAPR